MQLIKDASAEKIRGAYYTPTAIASFINKWGTAENKNAEILEPSCGDGVFLKCLRKDKTSFKSATAIEYESAEAEKARHIKLHDTNVINGDFHRYCLSTDKKFNLIVGNPPYIRYQYYESGQQELADEIFRRSGLKRTRLTNAWVTFVVGCCQLLAPKGKLGMVLPSELLQVKYAKQLRKFLADFFNKITIISFKNLVFEEIQQEVVILLCDKDGTTEHNIEHLELKDSSELEHLTVDKLKCPTKAIDFHADKWTCYFLEKEELDFLNKIRNAKIPTLSSFADVEVGITTGANSYFTVPESVVHSYQLEDYAFPMVGRSVQVGSACFTGDDWRKNVAKGAKAFMLIFTPEAKNQGEGVKAYLQNGEIEGINKGYKTSIRDYWYVIPSARKSDALFLRRNNTYPKFVLNEAGAYTTDTMHRVYIRKEVNKKALIASYYNSLSFIFAEILGRNFGGGCLELMPSEAGAIYLPYREENAMLFDTIDSMLRKNSDTDEILDITDNTVLCHGLGLSKYEASLARSIWKKIMGRRLGRKPIETYKNEKESADIPRYRELDLWDVLQKYPAQIVENVLSEPMPQYINSNLCNIDVSRNVLVSLVKEDNMALYTNHTAKIYYTGKRFPSTVDLNNLYYFMPYMKKKGIRDLYLIKTARVGTKQEVYPECEDNDFRLVFEIEYVGRLFNDYKPIQLEIWRTFTDTTISSLLKEPGNMQV